MVSNKPLDRNEFADSILNYVKTHEKYDSMSKEDLVRNTVFVLLSDIGAASEYLKVIGVDLDLYNYKPQTKREYNWESELIERKK